MITKIVLVLAGIILGYVLVGLFSALGHLIGGLLLGFKFDKFCIFLIEWTKQDGKIKFGLCDPQPFIFCNMTNVKEESRMRSLIYDAMAMALALFCTETLGIRIFGKKLIPMNEFTIPLIIVMIIYTLVIVVLLPINQKKRTGNSQSGMMIRAYEKAYSEMRNGTTPGNVEIEKIESEEEDGKGPDIGIYKKYLLMQYYHYLDLGDYDSIKKLTVKIEDALPDKIGHGDMGLLSEMVFFYSIIVPNERRAKYYYGQFEPRIDGSEETNAKRAFAYYLLFVKHDKGAALQITMEAIKSVSTYPMTGCRKMEKRMLDALLNRIESM